MTHTWTKVTSPLLFPTSPQSCSPPAAHRLTPKPSYCSTVSSGRFFPLLPFSQSDLMSFSSYSSHPDLSPKNPREASPFPPCTKSCPSSLWFKKLIKSSLVFLFFLSWSIVNLQYCVSFRHIAKWICYIHIYTYMCIYIYSSIYTKILYIYSCIYTTIPCIYIYVCVCVCVCVCIFFSHFMGNRWGNSGNSVCFFWAPKSLQMVIAAMKFKNASSLEGTLWPTLIVY